jgi:hypothetical protein
MVRQKEGAMGQRRTTRPSLRRIMTMMSALLLLALVTSGCTVFNGGGWLHSASDPLGITDERATFGINGGCQAGTFNIGGETVQGAGLAGQFQYDDHAYTLHGVGVQFHGEVTGFDTTVPIVLTGLTCQEVKDLFVGASDSPGAAMFLGTYRPQDRALAKECSKDPATSVCTFSGQIADLGEPGVQSGDELTITVTGGPFATYHNGGPIQGGNIQFS